MVVAGGRVWAEGGPLRADVLIEGARIAAVGERVEPASDAVVIDATGLEVLPGFIDLHVHAGDRIGRCELADSWATASDVAIRSGITTLFGFVTQQSGETLTEALERCLARTAGSRCEVRFHLTPTRWPWDWDEVEALAARGFSTFKLYTTYREAGLYTPYERFAELMPRLAALGGSLLVHCEDEGVLAAVDDGGIDATDPFSHTVMRPAAAEVEAIRRVVELARRTHCPTHIVHVSTVAGAAIVESARGAGAPVSCETAPHYLLLNDGALREVGGHRFLCTPPLRSEEVRRELEQMAVEGGFDVLATDHCAFARCDKDGWSDDFRAVPNGLAGVGSLVPLTHELLVVRHGRPLGELVAVLASGPARVAGLMPRKGVIRPGADADVVVLASAGRERSITASLADAYNPFEGRTTTLDVRWVIRRGEVAVDGGDVTGFTAPRDTRPG